MAEPRPRGHAVKKNINFLITPSPLPVRELLGVQCAGSENWACSKDAAPLEQTFRDR